MTNATTANDALEIYTNILKADGPAGLAFLNKRVPHRYTGVYQLKDGMLRNLYLFDKQGQHIPADIIEVPLQDSFCQFVLRENGFSTANTLRDRRLDGLRFQGALGSYHGLPILDNYGELFGTLCHFDAQCLSLDDSEYEFLRQAARLLPRYINTRALRDGTAKVEHHATSAALVA